MDRFKMRNLWDVWSITFNSIDVLDMINFDVRLYALEEYTEPTGLKALRVQDFVNQRVIKDPKAYRDDLEKRRLL